MVMKKPKVRAKAKLTFDMFILGFFLVLLMVSFVVAGLDLIKQGLIEWVKGGLIFLPLFLGAKFIMGRKKKKGR